MGTRLGFGDEQFEVVRWPQERGRSSLDPRDEERARRLLRQMMRDPEQARKLRSILAEDGAVQGVHRLSDNDVADQLSSRVSFGSVKVMGDADGQVKSRGTVAVQSAEPEEAPPTQRKTRSRPKTWIKIKVVSEVTGAPIPAVRIRVTTPDGVENFHTTSSAGVIEIDGIDEGECDLACDSKGATREDTLAFVAMGEIPRNDDDTVPVRRLGPQVKRIAEVELHKVKKDESILSLATGAGMKWQDLAKFNWGTDKPTEINECLRTQVGCTKKTKDGHNYMFDDSDDPGLMLIPRPWKAEGLKTGQTHVVRVGGFRHVWILFSEDKKHRLAFYEYLLFSGDDHIATGESNAEAMVFTEDLPTDWFIEVIGPGPSHPIWNEPAPEGGQDAAEDDAPADPEDDGDDLEDDSSGVVPAGAE